MWIRGNAPTSCQVPLYSRPAPKVYLTPNRRKQTTMLSVLFCEAPNSRVKVVCLRCPLGGNRSLVLPLRAQVTDVFDQIWLGVELQQNRLSHEN